MVHFQSSRSPTHNHMRVTQQTRNGTAWMESTLLTWTFPSESSWRRGPCSLEALLMLPGCKVRVAMKLRISSCRQESEARRALLWHPAVRMQEESPPSSARRQVLTTIPRRSFFVSCCCAVRLWIPTCPVTFCEYRPKVRDAPTRRVLGR